MGCGTSKSVQTIENETNSVPNGTLVNKDSVKQMNGSTTDSTTGAGSRGMSRPMTPVPKPVAFDIPLDDKPVIETNGSTLATDSNVPKKLPPKRLLTLAEQPGTQLTAKQLTEKQMKAEEKRLEILEERKLKAHLYNQKFLAPNNPTNSDNTVNNVETNNNGSQEPTNDDIQSEEKVPEINSNNNNNNIEVAVE